ncbi:MAG TPA: alpha-amylase family glycosyl hydrolase [Actinomycetota bacterium]|nr:alpha-amylase family glycosyl hydrolase [Actinomycetota bacterium]
MRGRPFVVFALALALGAGACTGGGDDPDDPAPTAPGGAEVQLIGTGGDVFAWEERVAGSGGCDEVTAVVDGQEIDVPVELEADGFTFTVPVATGAQTVTARCTSGGEVEETEPITLTGMLEPRPTARIDVEVHGDRVVFDGSTSEATQPDGAPVTSFTWTPHRRVGGEEPTLQLAAGGAFREETGERLELRAPENDGEYFVALTVSDDEGRGDTSVTYFVVEEGRARAVDLLQEHPAWIDTAIIYAPVHEILGGGAAAVEEHLPYLKELGADALWLWPPVTTRAPGEHYAIADYFTIDPEWGSEEELRSLVDRAHELGMYVLLDFVPNHSSIEHRYYQQAAAEGPGSHYWDFYDRKENGEHTYYFDWDYLPNLNYDNPQVRRMMTEAFAYWVGDVGIDGFRVDVAWGIKRRAPDYWLEWREELTRINPDLMLIAEATAREAYYFENGFDIGYDWTENPGQWPWETVWEFPEDIQGLLVPALTNQGEGYPRDALIMRFLNNNDTGPRFVERYGPELTRVASALQFTVTGIPMMFGGDEVGASYQPYSIIDPVPLDDEHGLRPWYDALIELRERLPALTSREMSVLTTDRDSVVAYVRPAVGGGDPVLVILNFGRRDERATISADPALADVAAAGVLEDALTGDRIEVRGADTLTLEVPAHSVHVLVPAGGGS